MEFQYRSIDRRQADSLPQPSGAGYFSQPAIRAGWMNSLHPSNPGLDPVWEQNHSLELTHYEALQRQLEKEQIRREIIAAEERRRVLEAEVRMELMMEQQMSMHHYIDDRFSFVGRIDHRRPINEPWWSLSGPRVDSSAPSNPFEEKPKRKATAPPLPSEWSCALCKVSASSEKGFNEHLKGKKHQALEETLIAKKNENRGGDSSKSKLQKKKDDAKFKGLEKPEKFKFWCKMCGVGAQTSIVMEDHNKGKKHRLNLEQKHKVMSMGCRAP